MSEEPSSSDDDDNDDKKTHDDYHDGKTRGRESGAAEIPKVTSQGWSSEIENSPHNKNNVRERRILRSREDDDDYDDENTNGGESSEGEILKEACEGEAIQKDNDTNRNSPHDKKVKRTRNRISSEDDDDDYDEKARKRESSEDGVPEETSQEQASHQDPNISRGKKNTGGSNDGDGNKSRGR